MMAGVFISMVISGLAFWSRYEGYFWWYITVETVLAVVVYVLLRLSLARVAWPSLE
jgi:hypothetical protein